MTTEPDYGDMNHQQFRAFVQRFRQLVVSKRRSDYDLGKWLYNVRDNRHYRVWPRQEEHLRGYETWHEFCDIEVGLKTSTAYTLARNYERLAEIGMDEDGPTFSRCLRLGYSKLSRVLKYARTEDALIEWLDVIEGESLSEMALRARLSAAQRASAQDNVDAAFDAGDPIDEGLIGPHAPLTDTNPAGYVPHNVRFPDQASLDTFAEAVEMIRRRYDQTLSVGRCTAMMALQYLATAPSDAEGGAVVELENVIRLFEAAYGVRLQVVTDEAATAARSTRISRARRSRLRSSTRAARDDASQ